MKRSATSLLWGLVIIVLGLLIGAKAFGVGIDISFRGWWAFFIIIPGAIGLCEKGNRTSSTIVLGIGVLCLLAARGDIQWSMFGKLLIALIFIVIGVKLIFDENKRNHKDGQDMNNNTNTYSYTYDTNNNTTDPNTDGSANYTDNTYSNDNNNTYSNDNNNTYSDNVNFNQGSNNGTYHESRNVTAIFSGKTLNYNGRNFNGVALVAIFGGIDLDLRNAVITKDVIIDITAVFGGMDIYVPSNVHVVTNCTPILGGVDNKTVSPSMVNGRNVPTIYVNGACIFGGVDIK